MSSEDPLLLLRSSLAGGHEIQLVSAAGDQVFDLPQSTTLLLPVPNSSTRRPFPKDSPTRYLSSGSLSDPDNAQYYDLQALLLSFTHKDAPLTDYLRAATAAGVAFVSTVDRRAVNDYLAGKTPSDGPEGKVRPLAGASPSKRAAEDEAGVGVGRAAAGGAAAAGGSGAAPPAKKQRYVPNREDQEAVKRMLQIIEGPAYGHVVAPGEEKKERTGAAYHNRETVLKGERVNNFDSVRSLIAPRLKSLRDDQSKSSSSGPQHGAPAQPAMGPGGKPQKKKQLNPIIIISPSSTALITMHNVKHFLEEARFLPSDEARALAATGGGGGYAGEDVVQVNHARSTSSAGTTAETRKARYFVVDGVEALSKFGGAGKLDEAWDRVVCVMTTGQEWQFKPYKWKEPKELFHHVKGVFPQWTTEPPNAKIRSWNVNELRIDPHKRHIDKSTVAEFWRSLEAWIAAHKPWLSY
ncbi:hypothetical protein JCM10207_008254 [Rhodosporidiobolus poonsookiae]